MEARSSRRPGDIVVIAVLIGALLSPAALALTGHAGFDVAFIKDTERRRPFVAPPPTGGALATGGWERDVERELADAFPLRTALIEKHNYAKYFWLRDSATQSVIRGTAGWLFLGDASEREYLAGAPPDADVVHAADIYASRARWCAQRRILYVFLLAPNKSTIYPQYLPAGLRRVEPSAADRLLPLLKVRGVRTIDVRADLIRASRNRAVYTRSDTHWNGAGAYLAYRATIAALAGAGVRDTIAPGALRPHLDLESGDLLRFSAISGVLKNAWLRYDFPHRAREVGAKTYPSDPDLLPSDMRGTVRDDRSLPVAVVFGDSFMDQLRPFLAEDFRRTLFVNYLNVGNRFDEPALEAERPNVVIQEIVERNLVAAASFRRRAEPVHRIGER